MGKLLHKFWPIGILIILETVLFLTNYDRGTYLLGWDTIMPEFNFQANLWRNISGVWATYRGLGLLDGMAHTANLVHTLCIWLLSFFFPQNMLRYVFTFTMHLLGGIGVYKLLTSLTDKDKPIFSKSLALITGLFYQYNLDTVQMFYAPLEVFSVHFAALPWLSYTLLNYLKHQTKHNLVIFFITSFIFTPQAFVPSVWIAYVISLGWILLFHLISHPHNWKKITLTIIGVLSAVNAFWLLPYLYSATQNSAVIASTKINIMSNADIALKQKEFADFPSVATLRGFSLNHIDYQQTGIFDYMMSQWRTHIYSLPMTLLSWFFFATTTLGAIGIFLRKQRSLYAFFAIFVTGFILLGSDIPIIGWIFKFFSDYVPYFGVIFRFTFTKFAFLYVFGYSVLFAAGILIVQKKLKFAFAKEGLLALFAILVLAVSLPSFQGNFLYKNLRVKLPTEYLNLFTYFKKEDPSRRIALLPAHQYWSWVFYKWGGRGSGFLWYGLEQPTLDRAFDPWSRQNENFYWELSHAAYSQNPQQFEKVLEKYQVDYLLFDHNVFAPDNPKSLYTDKIEELLHASLRIQKIEQFGNIEVYKFMYTPPTKNFTFKSQNAASVSPNYEWNNADQAYSEKNLYYSDEKNPDTIYPFRTLFTNRRPEDLVFKITEQPSEFTLSTPVSSKITSDYNLVTSTAEELPQVNRETLAFDNFLIPTISRSETDITLHVPKATGYLSYDSELDSNIASFEPVRCDNFRKGPIDRYAVFGNFLRFSSVNSSNCLDISLSHLPQRYSYLIGITSRHTAGKTLLFSVINQNSGRTEIETYLPISDEPTTSYFILPPMEQYGQGYTLHIDNISIGQVKSLNDLGRIVVYPFPYEYVSSLKFESQSRQDNSLFVLSQSYDSGWLAYETPNELARIMPLVFGKRLTDHVMVNNWANGWKLPDGSNSQQITIVYWPQYLEYIGFGILTFTLLYLLLAKNHRPR